MAKEVDKTIVEIGVNLKMIRESTGITQEHLCRKMGIPRTSLVQIENGKRNLTATEIKSLCVIFEITADEIIGESPIYTDTEIIDALKMIQSLTSRQKYLAYRMLKIIKAHHGDY